MASRDLKDLTKDTELLARVFVSDCKDSGIDVLIYCTLRTVEEQNALYRIGRDLPGRIVTGARGGESWHNYGRAFDFVPLLSGKPQWGDRGLYLRCGKIAESIGLEWAGRWTGKIKETAHCQNPAGNTLADLKKGVL